MRSFCSGRKGHWPIALGTTDSQPEIGSVLRPRLGCFTWPEVDNGEFAMPSAFRAAGPNEIDCRVAAGRAFDHDSGSRSESFYLLGGGRNPYGVISHTTWLLSKLILYLLYSSVSLGKPFDRVADS